MSDAASGGLAGSEEFLRLGETLRRRCGKGPVPYFANPGNWGDALIRAGSLAFFREIGLEIEEWRRPPWFAGWGAKASKGPLILGGGGGWCEAWDHGERAARRWGRRFDVIVLPSTFGRPVSIPNATLFARDSAESIRNAPGALFCHDMSFCLRAPAFPPGEGEGHFFRSDRESARRVPIPSGNDDVSLRGDHRSDPAGFFASVARFASVRTDRMHVAIAACLLGRYVRLYPNAYFKNRAIFDSSIRGRFPGMAFCEE